ncbi:MAG: hypothetical protein FWG37_02570 [Clostridia bacterium]|nr:hypothetical protein [Clostridia bacterium]
MRTLTENPAVRLRNALRSALPDCMLHCDTSGRALFVSDAVRRGMRISLPRETETVIINGILYIDCSEDIYRALLQSDFYTQDSLQDRWFAEQSLLASILRQPIAPKMLNRPFLRTAMAACVTGEDRVRGFIRTLRGEQAAALRVGLTGSCRAAAVLCAHYLFTVKNVGLPIRPSYDTLFFDHSASIGER